MEQVIFKRLFDSFNELERAIELAKATLEKKDNPPERLLKHISGYEEILLKQRSLAEALCSFACDGNWEEVGRHVKLINGLSAMIRDDAREVLAGFKPNDKTADRDLPLT